MCARRALGFVTNIAWRLVFSADASKILPLCGCPCSGYAKDVANVQVQVSGPFETATLAASNTLDRKLGAKQSEAKVPCCRSDQMRDMPYGHRQKKKKVLHMSCHAMPAEGLSTSLADCQYDGYEQSHF